MFKWLVTFIKSTWSGRPCKYVLFDDALMHYFLVIAEVEAKRAASSGRYLGCVA